MVFGTLTEPCKSFLMALCKSRCRRFEYTQEQGFSTFFSGKQDMKTKNNANQIKHKISINHFITDRICFFAVPWSLRVAHKRRHAILYNFWSHLTSSTRFLVLTLYYYRHKLLDPFPLIPRWHWRTAKYMLRYILFCFMLKSTGFQWIYLFYNFISKHQLFGKK